MSTTKSHAHHATLTAAATADVHDHPHTTETKAEVLDLTDGQKKLVASLHFLSSYEIAHLRKASPDVAAAFDDVALTTIEKNGELGGKERADRIRSARALHEQLAAIANIVAPVARVVGQALMKADSDLAREAGEPLKVAHALSRTKPALIEGLAALDKWSHAHHGAGRPAASATPVTPAAKP